MKFSRILLFFFIAILILSSVFPAVYASEMPPEEEKTSEIPVSEEPTSEEPTSAEPVISDVKGDPDGDGKVTAADARFALRTSVGLEKPIPEIYALCDYDEDGKVAAADARCILRVAVGLDPFKTQEEIEKERREEEEKQWQEYVNGVINAASKESVTATLKSLTKQTPDRGIFRSNNDKAEKYLVARLKEAGFTEDHINIYASSWEGARIGDIVASIPTAVPNPDICLLCAHYDCAEGVEGAVDNASGVAAVMEAARLLKAMNKDFGAELRFAFFDGEEKGYIGAYRYLSVNSEKEQARHTFVLNVDMAGFSNLQPQKYLVISTEPVCEPWPWREAKANFTGNSVDAAKGFLGNLGEEKYYSPVSAGMHDIVPFRKKGIACATLSWRQYDSYSSHGSDYGLASPYTIHTSGDTLENLNIDSVVSSARLITASVLFALKK